MLDALIKTGMQRAELETKAVQSELDASHAERRLAGVERTLEGYRNAIEAVIAPIE